MLQGLYKNNEELEKQARNYSIIHWETGEPKEEGAYLITTLRGKISFDRWLTELPRFTDEDNECGWEYNREVIAWCKLSDIEPYKEEEK